MGLERLFACLLLAACTPTNPPVPGDNPYDDQPVDTGHPHLTKPVRVRVTLNGQPAPDAVVYQGGVSTAWTPNPRGIVDLRIDTHVPGFSLYVLASHPQARTGVVEVRKHTEEVHVRLQRFDDSDNPNYFFQDPGGPDDRAHTGKCAHCHVTINEGWYGSAHRTSASNPAVQATYGQAMTELPNGETGACADCHAPGIDGQLGGRFLDEATGLALDNGVHCDVCHKVESVDLDAPAGVAGRLRVLRPSEPGPQNRPLPLYFGPYADVGNPFMGAVARPFFRQAELCAGCHQLDQQVFIGAIDTNRWPDGTLPIHSTYEEWLAGPLSPAATCQRCHMPPAADVGNAADLGNLFGDEGDLGSGWYRPAGEVRHHTFDGPRGPDERLVKSAAALFLSHTVDAGTLDVTVTTRNAGAGHAIPTGEPMRSLVLLVQATCAGTPLVATGGDTVPDFGGALDQQDANGDWSTWPGASVGDVVRVVRRSGAWRDYTGFGPFGDGTFDAAAKGMPVEEVVGASVITAMNGDVATFDAPLPAGDVAYRGEGGGLPADGDPATARAGAPGFGFARVLVDANGVRHVPHHRAVDVVSDNRLLPQQTFTTTHSFDATCASPEVSAVLVHRRWPPGSALGTPDELVLAEVRR